ncbi:MAG TPA: hypothetical protein VJO13_00905 [Ktedonobacterales bacterium]|nr:hypothetical protein [Ktedonobacterales bacterium]
MHGFVPSARGRGWRQRAAQLAIGFSLIVGLCAGAFLATGAHAQPRSTSGATLYHATGGTGARLPAGQAAASQRQAASAQQQGPRVIPYRTPMNPKGVATRSLSRGAPKSNAAPLTTAELTNNFNGLSNADQTAANGGIGAEVTPPDQGLCVGHDPRTTASTSVFEMVNDATAEYDTHGNLLRPIQSNASFFNDPNTFSDPRCFYDATTSTFFFTNISSASFGAANDTFDEVAVLNEAHGFTVYKFDSSLGGTCFGDQPHVGYDNHNLYIATDQFCNTGYLGALLLVISKSQLVSEVASPNVASFGPLSLSGIPILTLEPAISPHQNTEFLLNSFPMDANGNPLPTSTSLGFWQVLGGQNVTSGNFSAVTLASSVITSEQYAFTVPAASTGSGAVTTVCDVFCVPVESEASLNPDDDRMLQVMTVGSGNNLQLWGALDTSLTIAGDTATRDGVAWFEIAPLSAEHGNPSPTIAHQGYVAVKGNNLLYPAIFARDNGSAAMVFTITGPTLNPSAAYAVTPFGSTVHIVATGAGPHLSFAEPLSGRKRWGDYSAACMDPSTGAIWQATEYIPPAAHQDPFDNWGTDVFATKLG